MTTSIISINSIQRRKVYFEIRNTLFRRRDILRKALFNRTDVDHEVDLRCELKRIENVLEQMRRGDYGKCRKTGNMIPIERLLTDPFLATIE